MRYRVAFHKVAVGSGFNEFVAEVQDQTGSRICETGEYVTQVYGTEYLAEQLERNERPVIRCDDERQLQDSPHLAPVAMRIARLLNQEEQSRAQASLRDYSHGDLDDSG